MAQPQTYEITFTGQAGERLQAQFDDCDVWVGRGVTTLRVRLPDRAALTGLIERISFLRLEILDVLLVAAPPDQ